MEKYDPAELKLVYRLLHRNLLDDADLLDSQFFADLQTFLMRLAQTEGVNVADHGAWDAWLGNAAVSCETRMTRRVSRN